MASTKVGQIQLVTIPPLDPNAFDTLQPSRFSKVYLYDEADQSNYRYELTVIDRPLTQSQIAATTLPCGVFLIPAGRETEYLFSSPRGLQNIAESAGCARLISVAFHRAHVYDSQRIVQAELEFVVQVIARRGSFLYSNRNARERAFLEAPNFHIPFMAIDGIGKRNVVAEGDTETTGHFLVEEVHSNEGGTQRILRRLYFIKNQNVIQSEVRVQGETGKVDATYLAFEYHKELVAGFVALALIPCESESMATGNALVIGLGGGGLLSFLRGLAPQINITAVELDEHVLAIAKSYFGFHEDDKMSVLIGDGLGVGPKRLTDETLSPNEQSLSDDNEGGTIQFDTSSLGLVVIDVDSKDASVGISCPPVPFLSPAYLTALSSILHTNGVLAINVSARDPSMLATAKGNILSVFDSVFVSSSSEDDEDLNVVIFAKKNKSSLPSKAQLAEELRKLNDKGVRVDEDVCSWLQENIACIEPLNNHSPCQNDGSKTRPSKKGKKTNKKKGKKR